jgi:hypothetical protein
MKRKTLLIACSLLMAAAVLAGLLTGCTGAAVVTSTNTSTTTVTQTQAPATSTTTVTAPGETTTLPAETSTVTTTGAVTTSTVIVSSTQTVTQIQSPVLEDVLNPVISPVYVARRALTTPRPTSLAGKYIYVVGDGWGGPAGGDRLMKDILVPYLKQQYPTAIVEFRYKAGMYSTDDPTLWAEIASHTPNAVCIVGISG